MTDRVTDSQKWLGTYWPAATDQKPSSVQGPAGLRLPTIVGIIAMTTILCNKKVP